MTSAGSVSINLFANISSFEKGINKATGLLGSIGSSLLSVQGIASGFLAWKGVEFLKGTLDTIDSQAKLADRLGTSTEALVGLTHAGDLAGVSADQLATAMEKMSRNVADAGMGGKAAMDTLGQLGLKFSDLAQLKPEEQLGVVADHLNQLSSAGEKSKVAVELFGKAGAGMVNVLQEGSAGLQAMQKDAEFLGLTFSRMDAAKVEQANDAFTRLGSSLKGGLIDAAIELSPILTAIANGFILSAKQAGGFGNVAVSVIDTITEKIGVLFDAWNVLSTAFYGVKAAFRFIEMSIYSVLNDIYRGLQWIGGILSNFLTHIENTFSALGHFFLVLWAGIKKGVVEVAAFAVSTIAGTLEKIATGATYINTSLGESVKNAATAMQQASAAMSETVNGEFTKATEDLGKAIDKTADSFTNLFTVAEAQDSEFLKSLYDSAQKSGEDAAVGFVDSWDAVLKQKGTQATRDWLAEVDAMAQANAQKVADSATVRNSGTPFGPNPLEEKKGPSITDKLAAEYDVRKEYSKKFKSIEDEDRENAENNAALWADGWRGKGQVINQVLSNLSTLMNSHSKRAFQIGKMAAIAQATINTASAVVGAYNSMVGIPFVGPALAVAAAAAAAAAGMVQIQNIKSTTFGGGGSVSSSSGSISLVNGEPAGVGASAAGVTGNQRNVIQLNFTGLSDNALLNGRQVRELITQINEAQQDGSPVITVNAAAA